MPRWEVRLIGKKGHRYGTVEARDEREATAKAAEEFQIPPELRFKIAVTELVDKKHPRRSGARTIDGPPSSTDTYV
jgi:hypothetical protein